MAIVPRQDARGRDVPVEDERGARVVSQRIQRTSGSAFFVFVARARSSRYSSSSASTPGATDRATISGEELRREGAADGRASSATAFNSSTVLASAARAAALSNSGPATTASDFS